LSLSQHGHTTDSFVFPSPVVLYGYETWSATLGEEHRLWVFENRVLRGIFGSKIDKMMGSWRRLHNEKLHNLYTSPNNIRVIKSRRMRWAGHVTWIGEMRNACSIFVGKVERGRIILKCIVMYATAKVALVLVIVLIGFLVSMYQL
jgi:hypothetical protein